MAETTEKPQVHETNIKETIESILVAFVLAFIFRCFVVEAFVIPTGSMAPTLMGAHMVFDCPDCGYGYTVSYRDGDRNSMFVPDRARVQVTADRTEARVMAIFCPNCGYRLPRVNQEDPDQSATEPPVRYGDRILVMKYAYLINPAKRWDVVVFKSPQANADPTDRHPRDEQMLDYSVNYIKRLVGLPGESVFMAAGDLYVCPPGSDATNLDNYKVQTKPRHAQDALWRIVYDADYIPRKLDRTVLSADGQPYFHRRADSPNNVNEKLTDFPWAMPWVANDGSGWNVTTLSGEKRHFKFDNPTGSGSLIFDDKITPQKGALTDWLAYDVTEAQGGVVDSYKYDSYALSNMVFPVSDLKISCFVDEIKDDAALQLQLQKGDILFTAELKRGQVRLVKQVAGNETIELAKAPATLGDRPAKVEFENVDYRVALRIDGKNVLVTTPLQYAPDLKKIVEDTNANRRGPYGAAMINARNGKIELSHVQLWRDVYYRDMDPQVLRATTHRFPERVVTLSNSDYFVLGDNSSASSDACMWDNHVRLPSEELDVEAGRVPERFMLGRAFFVYWPAGYRPGGSLPPLIPNFGRMRFIH